MRRDQAKSKQSEGLWVALIQSECSGVPPHQSLSAWRPGRITPSWVVEKPMACWAQTQRLKMTPGIWDWDRRALGFTSYLPTLLPTANKLCFAQSPSRDLLDCLNKEPCGCWAPPPTCHPLRICKHQGVRATNRPRRTMATSIKLMSLFQG